MGGGRGRDRMLMKLEVLEVLIGQYPSTSGAVPTDLTSYCLCTRSKVSKCTFALREQDSPAHASTDCFNLLLSFV